MAKLTPDLDLNEVKKDMGEFAKLSVNGKFYGKNPGKNPVEFWILNFYENIYSILFRLGWKLKWLKFGYLT